MPVPEPEIVCVDCGGPAYLITPPREDGTWLPGDLVTYRCRDCRDRWDLLLPEDDVPEDDVPEDDVPDDELPGHTPADDHPI